MILERIGDEAAVKLRVNAQALCEEVNHHVVGENWSYWQSNVSCAVDTFRMRLHRLDVQQTLE